MNDLDGKIKELFKEESVLKTPERYQIFHGNPLPSFIKDWLIKRFTDKEGDLEVVPYPIRIWVFSPGFRVMLRRGLKNSPLLEGIKLSSQPYLS